MTDWHGYSLFIMPPALRLWEWRAILLALRPIWDTRPDDPQPARRMQVRWNADKTQVIVESVFDRDDLNIENAERLAKYICDAANEANEHPPQVGVDDDGNPVYDDARSYTVAQVQAAMRDMITLWAVNGTWAQSGELARQHLRESSIPWTGIGCVVLTPQDVSGLQTNVAGAYYKRLVDMGDYRLWSVSAEVDTLRELHAELWAMTPAGTLGALAVVQEFGVSFWPDKVRTATGMTAAQALARRNRIANYLDGLGHDTTLLRTAVDEEAQLAGIATALGATMDLLWRAM